MSYYEIVAKNKKGKKEQQNILKSRQNSVLVCFLAF